MAPGKKTHGPNVSQQTSSSKPPLKRGAKTGFYAGLLSGFFATVIYLFVVRATTYSDAIIYPLFDMYTPSTLLSQPEFVLSRLVLFISSPLLVGAGIGPALGASSSYLSFHQRNGMLRFRGEMAFGIAFWFVLVLVGYLIVPASDGTYLSILVAVALMGGLFFGYALIHFGRRQ